MMDQTNQQKSPKKQLSDTYPSITLDQWRYIAARLNESTDTAEANAIGVKRNTVSTWKNKKEIDALLIEWASNTADGSRAALEKQSLKAAMVLLGLLDSEDERIRIDAAKNILDRVNGKPAQRNTQEITLTNVDVSKLTDAELEAIIATRSGDS